MIEDRFRFYVNTTDACAITDRALHDCHSEIASQDNEIISVKDLVIFGVGLFLGAKLSKL